MSRIYLQPEDFRVGPGSTYDELLEDSVVIETTNTDHTEGVSPDGTEFFLARAGDQNDAGTRWINSETETEYVAR